MNRRPLKIRAVCLLLICCLTQAAAFAHGDCQSDKASNPYPNPLNADTTEPATPEHGISRLGHCDDMATSSNKIERPAQTDDQNDNAQNCCDSSSAGCAIS